MRSYRGLTHLPFHCCALEAKDQVISLRRTALLRRGPFERMCRTKPDIISFDAHQGLDWQHSPAEEQNQNLFSALDFTSAKYPLRAYTRNLRPNFSALMSMVRYWPSCLNRAGL